MNTLKGRTAVITGAPPEILRILLEGGMRTVMFTHRVDAARKKIDDLADLGAECSYIECSVDNAEETERAFKQVFETYGSVDVVIACHGGRPTDRDFEDLSGDILNGHLGNIVTGSFNMIKYALPYLKKSTAARVILTASSRAFTGNSEKSLSEAICHGAISALTVNAAQRLKDYGITVNCILRDGAKVPTETTVINGTIFEAVAYLAGEESGELTGKIIRII